MPQLSMISDTSTQHDDYGGDIQNQDELRPQLPNCVERLVNAKDTDVAFRSARLEDLRLEDAPAVAIQVQEAEDTAGAPDYSLPLPDAGPVIKNGKSSQSLHEELPKATETTLTDLLVKPQLTPPFAQKDFIVSTTTPEDSNPIEPDPLYYFTDVSLRSVGEVPADLDNGLSLVIFDLEREDVRTFKLERETPSSWRLSHAIELSTSTQEITFVAESEEGSLGHVFIGNDVIQLRQHGEGNTYVLDFGVDATEWKLSLKFRVSGSRAAEDIERDHFSYTYSLARRGNPEILFAVATSMPDSARKARYLSLCAQMFHSRFNTTVRQGDINNAIAAYNNVIRLTCSLDHDIYVSHLFNRGLALALRFNAFGDPEDLRQAILSYQAIVDGEPQSHRLRIPAMEALVVALAFAHKTFGDPEAIGKSIVLQRELVNSIPLDDDTFPQHLHRLWTLLLQYPESQNLVILSEAISTMERAVDAAQFIPKYCSRIREWFFNLAQVHYSRYLHTEDVIYVSDAISSLRKGIGLHPGEVKNNFLLALSAFLFLRFIKKHASDGEGDLDDISEAILLMERLLTLEESPISHLLECLSYCYISRFELLQDFEDISNAISVLEKRMQFTHENDQEIPNILERMSFLLQERFKFTNNPEDLSLAIAMEKERNNTESPVADEDRVKSLVNIAKLQLDYAGHTQELADLDEAILSLRTATELEDIHGLSSRARSLLPIALIFRSHRTANSGAELEEAEALALNAMNGSNGAVPAERQNAALYLSLINCFRLGGNSETLETLGHLNMQLLSEIAPPSQPIQTRHSALSANNLEDLSKYRLLLSSTTIDKDTRSELFSRPVRDRNFGVLDETSPRSLCVWLALNSDRLNLALEWLENGRCHVWNQLNQLRTPIEDLRAHDPMLAERFLKLSEALEAAGSRPEQSLPSASPRIPQEEWLDRDWTQLLEDIRMIPNFQNFLQPPRASDILENLPTQGPVIIVYVGQARCTALALLSGNDEPISIDLKDFTYAAAERLRRYLTSYLVSRGRMRAKSEDRGIRKVNDHPLRRNVMHTVLEALWVLLVKPILDALGYSPTSDPGRIWWSTTGPLASLPIHAAGIYSPEITEPGSCLSDYAVSSYTPTASILIEKFKSVQAPVQPRQKLLLISLAQTAGLPGTEKEVEALQMAMHSFGFEALHLKERAATVNQVREEMKTHTWIHFACHGSQDITEPLQSAFHLYDGPLNLSEIIKQRPDNAEFAFLSACQTSTGVNKLSDESVHLAAGMHVIGYRSVVGTLWSIMDKYAPMVAEDFYGYLLDGTVDGEERKSLDCEKTAYALHYATQRLRHAFAERAESMIKDPLSPGETEVSRERRRLGAAEEDLLAWVPYIHFGV